MNEIPDFQFGFQKNSFTNHELLNVKNDIKRNLDIEKEFDIVWPTAHSSR